MISSVLRKPLPWLLTIAEAKFVEMFASLPCIRVSFANLSLATKPSGFRRM